MSETKLEVVQLPPIDRNKTVQLLADLLEEAKTGAFDSVVVFKIRSDGTWNLDMSGTESLLRQVSILELMKYDVLRRLTGD